MSMFARRHYVAIAATLCHIPQGYQRLLTATLLADLFASDNPRFDRQRFLKACAK